MLSIVKLPAFELVNSHLKIFQTRIFQIQLQSQFFSGFPGRI